MPKLPEEDVDIEVTVTENDTLHAFRVKIIDDTGRPVIITLTARSLIDLHKKLGVAFCEWSSQAAMAILGIKGLF